MAESLVTRLLSPRIALPAMLLIITLVVLFAPDKSDPDEQARLTTYSTGAGGARGLYETLRRLGYRVERLEKPASPSDLENATYALMAPPLGFTAAEVSTLLGAVRAGTNLFFVIAQSDPLIDSLRVHVRTDFRTTVSESLGEYATVSRGDPSCAPPVKVLPVGFDLSSRQLTWGDSVIQLSPTVNFVSASSPSASGYLAMGIQVGRGRVVVTSSPTAFQNGVLRRCDRREGVLAVRMFHWATNGGQNRIVFDEWRHGYGVHTSTSATIRSAIIRNPAGRVLLQLIAAVLVVMLAVGARPIPPRPRERIERRSPFEHVGALARAYEKVGATRRATRLLVRGVRRRRDATAWRKGSDEEFLQAVAASHPNARREVEVLLGALGQTISPADFIKVGQAVAQLERTLSSEYS